MIKYDKSQAAFDPPSLNFERNYADAILIFDDIVWNEIIEDGNFEAVRSQNGRTYENFRETKVSNKSIL